MRRTVPAAVTVPLAVFLVAPAAAVAASPPATEVVQISACEQLVKDGTYLPGSDGTVSPEEVREWEAEGTIAVDPTDRKRLTAVWVQDYQEAIVAAYSADGGDSWQRSVLKTGRWTWGYHGEEPPESGGNDFAETNSVNDPVVSIGPSPDRSAPGVIYASSVVASPGFGRSAVVVNVSEDGGRTWSNPAVIDTATMRDTVGQTLPFTGTQIDQTHIAADPARAGHAYAMWMKVDWETPTLDVFVSRTADSGKSWTDPVRVSEPLTDRWDFAPQVVVLSDGRLLATWLEVPAQPLFEVTGPHGPSRWFSAVSADQGATWTRPRLIAESPHVVEVAGLTAGPDGAAYVSWLDTDAEMETLTVHYRKSHDYVQWTGGQVGEPIASSPQTASNGLVAPPAIAITSSGTIGIAFYDHRNDEPTTEPQETGYWLRSSVDDGVTWEETRVAGPFDASSAPSFNGQRSSDESFPGGTMGDYQGLAAAGSDFAMRFVLGDDLPGAGFELTTTCPNGTDVNGTDVYFTRLRADRPSARTGP